MPKNNLKAIPNCDPNLFFSFSLVEQEILTLRGQYIKQLSFSFCIRTVLYVRLLMILIQLEINNRPVSVSVLRCCPRLLSEAVRALKSLPSQPGTRSNMRYVTLTSLILDGVDHNRYFSACS